MDNQELMSKLATLPTPDFLHANKLSDPIASGSSYRADTVVRLIAEAVKAERERCAAYCEGEGLFQTARAIRAGEHDA